MSLVLLSLYSSTSSHILFQLRLLEAITLVVEITVSEGWDLESCRVQIKSFAKMSSFASRTIEEASVKFSSRPRKAPIDPSSKKVHL